MSSEHPILFIRNADLEYVPVDDDAEWIAKIAFVIDNGESYAPMLGPLLVRRGNHGRWFYYPVPLLFKTEQERIAAATQRGKNPPQEWWIRRCISLMYRIARRENKLAA